MAPRLAILLLVLASLLMLHECTSRSSGEIGTVNVGNGGGLSLGSGSESDEDKIVIGTCMKRLYSLFKYCWWCITTDTGCYQTQADCEKVCPPNSPPLASQAAPPPTHP